MPKVSVIVPCYNEQATITLLLEAISKQTYPQSQIEVIIADGMSTDQTRVMIQSFSSLHPDISLLIVDNPARHIPAALNKAIGAAKGEFILRLDAHSIPAPDYIERCIDILEGGIADNVGGVWEIVPGNSSWQARGIAAAAAHPLGAGDAYYRVGSTPRFVDTVPFGAFRKLLIDRLGGFDEELLSNEDYELNVRIRMNGGKIYLDPEIRSIYYARSDFIALGRQYLRYGYWKGQMLRRYPKTLRWRQAIPPMFVLIVLVLSLLSLWFDWTRIGLVSILALYLSLLFLSGITESIKRKDLSLIFGVPISFMIMHFSWGGALLWNAVGLK